MESIGILAIILVVIIVGIIVVSIIKTWIKRITIYEYQRGLRYQNGKFDRVLEAGQYWYNGFTTTINVVDTRASYDTIQGQEVLSKDGVTIKVSLVAHYKVSDPAAASHEVLSFYNAVYLEVQLALREIIGVENADDLIEKRNQIGKKLWEATSPKLKEIGIDLIAVNIKDLMFPGELKQIFTQVIKARKEGLAILEKTRAETAALRNLANAARLTEKNPNIMQLRLIQALSGSSGHTIILGMPPQMTPITINRKETTEITDEENHNKENINVN